MVTLVIIVTVIVVVTTVIIKTMIIIITMEDTVVIVTTVTIRRRGRQKSYLCFSPRILVQPTVNCTKPIDVDISLAARRTCVSAFSLDTLILFVNF